MKTSGRSIVYLISALALLAVFVVAPGAWAEPLQDRLGQTVPSMTPTRSLEPTLQPTAAVPTAGPTQRPGSSPVPPADTPVSPPEVVPAETATPLAPAAPAASPLALVKAVSRAEVWPGATVVFTLTLTNISTASVRQVGLEDVLPEGLEPGAIQGTDAMWDGRTLRAQRAVLPPGGRLTVVFAARIADEVPEGGVIVNQAIATAGASTSPSLRITASALMILPPVELPPTGASRGCAGPTAD